MPDVTPAGPLSVAVDALRTLIANVAFFQTWVNAADATAALASVFVGEVGYPAKSIVIAAGVATVAMREPHQIQVGDIVTMVGASIGPQSILGLDGAQTVLAVTASTFTFDTTSYALADQGPHYLDECFVIPAERPIAVISESEDSPLHSTSIATDSASIFSGTLEIMLEADVSADYRNDHRNALYEARNAYGNFVVGLAGKQGTGDFMVLNTIEPVAGPTFIALSEQDDNTVRFERWRAMVRVTWGLS